MRLPALRLLSSFALALAAAPVALHAQRVLGPGEDAVTIPRGMLRIGVGGELSFLRDRWTDGVLEPLGAGFSVPALGPAQLAILAPLQSDVRALGATDFEASLGATRLDLRQRLFVTPFSLEFGVADWLTLGVTAPLVRSRAESQFRLDGANGLATVGLNPYFLGAAVPGGNRATIDQFSSAATSLASRRDACMADAAAAPECATILAESADVDALIARSSGFATTLGTVYGGAGLPAPAPYVPMQGSAAEQLLLTRVDSLRDAFTRYGVGDIAPGTGLPLGAQAPLTADDLARLLADSTSGYGARPLANAGRIDIGDVDVGLKVRLFDTFGGSAAQRLAASRFGMRQSFGLTYRIGSGIPAPADDFLDLGTGNGEDAIGVRSYTDVVFGARFWTTIVVGWARAEGGDVRVRLPSYDGQQLLESWRETDVQVTRGAVLQAEVAPRFHLNDFLAVGGYWGWRQHAEDEYTGIPATAPVPFSPALMAPSAERDEHRAGFSVTFSSLAAHADGRVRRPFEISWAHHQSVASGTGVVPKRWEDRLQFRYYARLFGR
jgi:hypothetical protein